MASIYELGSKWRAQVCVNGRRITKVHPTQSLAEAWARRKERSCLLASARERGALLSATPQRYLDALASIEFTENDVVQGSIPVTISPGVYFLINEGRISYIGKTINLFSRLARHKNEGRKFDAYNFIPCAKDDLDRMKSLYITAILPHGNKML